MINSLHHAKAVQKRREESGKPGIAKAVRRYIWRTNNNARYADALRCESERQLLNL